jgi:hypothetical protein
MSQGSSPSGGTPDANLSSAQFGLGGDMGSSGLPTPTGAGSGGYGTGSGNGSMGDSGMAVST